MDLLPGEAVTAGADRADRIREALLMVEGASAWRTERIGVWCFTEEEPPSADIPPGSVVLTADEAKRVRHALTWEGGVPPALDDCLAALALLGEEKSDV
jgi:hypothetical protein